MSNVQSNLVERFVEVVRGSTPTQVGIASAIALGGATVAWMFAPYLKLGASAAKGEVFSFLYGTPEQRLLDHVKKTAKKNDPQSVLDTIDDFCWKNQWMMNVGNIKGQILDKAVNEANPKLVVELGCYCGYSSIRMGRLLQPGSKIYSIEANPKFAAIAGQMIEFAGLGDVCKIFVGKSTETLPLLPQLIHGLNNVTDPSASATIETDQKLPKLEVDLFFIDHVKWLYLQDFMLIEQLGYLRKGSVLVADNVIFPGAPDYLKYIRQNTKAYKSTFNASTVEYSEIPDGVEVTIVQ